MDRKFLESMPKEHFASYVDDIMEAMRTTREHDKPSDDTLKMFKEFGGKMEEGFAKLHEKINGLKDEFVPRRECSLIHGRTEEEINLIVGKAVEAAMEKCDVRYASKLTEKIVYGLAGLILLSVATIIIAGAVNAFN